MAEVHAPGPGGRFVTHRAAAPGNLDGSDSYAREIVTETITSIDGIRELRSDYEHLHQSARNTLPFALQDWHLIWCEHFLNRNPRVEQQPLFFVLRDSRQECVSIVPLITTRRRVGPVKLVTVDFVGADPGVTEIRGPLISPGYERITVRAVHDGLAEIPDWDWIEWSGLDAATAQALDLETVAQWCGVSDDYILDLPSSWDELRVQFHRNVRESLRHCYNSLRRDHHAFEFVVAREPEDVRHALKRFLELHAMRARMPWGPKHPDRFAARALQAFLYDLCNRLAASGAVRVFQLRIAGEIVASRIGFVVADSVYLYYSGFDPAWARYSVMTTTVSEALKYSIAHGIKTINLSLYTERSKLRWRPRHVAFRSALVNREALSSRMASMAYRLARSSDGLPARLLKGLFWSHRHWD